MDTRRAARAGRLAPPRVCAVEGCTTRLSVYNTQSYCWLHRHLAGEVPRRERSLRAVTITGVCARAGCDNTFTTVNMSRKYCSDRCRMLAFQQRAAQARLSGEMAA